MKKLTDIQATRKDFPSDFLWGASVSSHQVEGKNTNQWSVWESETAALSAKNAAKKWSWMPIWNDAKDQAENPLNYVSSTGVDHYTKYPLDFKLARSLNLNSFRTGIEWSRINPKEGVFNPKEIEHYNTYLKEMKNQGLEPLVNLFHWTLPVWFAEKGGFTNGSNMKYWKDFVHTIAQNIDFSEIKYVLTINEPNVYAFISYFSGEWPPQEKNFITAWVVYRRLAKAHKIAYKILKKKWPHLQIGGAAQLGKVVGESFSGKIFAWVHDHYWNWYWLRIAKYHDFIGFNYYFTDYRKGFEFLSKSNPKKPLNDLGWYMEPSGIEWVIMKISKKYPTKEIIITENGVADMHDTFREWWIAETMETLHRCIKNGAKVSGYMHWSLLDNFEWAYGWFPKFGLISVDRKTMKRTVKKSALAWAEWLKI